MIYDFRNKETGEISQEEMMLCEREPFLGAHPELEQILICPPKLGDPVKLGVKKVPGDFQHGIIDRIAAATPGNKLHTSRFRQNLGEV
jgi:hypothetical protein